MATRDKLLQTLDNDQNAQGYDDPDRYVKKISWAGRKYAFKRAIKKFGFDQGTDLSALLTYYTVLSLAPGLLAVFSIISLTMSANADVIQEMIDDVVAVAVPADYQALVYDLVETMMGSATGGVIALIIGVVTALWSASAYVKAFSRNMNTMYGITEGRNPIKQTLSMLAITLAMLVGVVIVLVCLALNATLIEGLFAPIAEPLGLTAVLTFLTDSFLPIWSWAKYIVVAIIAILLIAVLYHFTPNVRRPKFRWFSTGAIIALIGLGLGGVGLGIYLTYFASYSSYGAIGTIMAVLFVLWVFNIVILLGAFIDHELFRVKQLESGITAEENVKLPPRGVTKTEKTIEQQDGLIKEAAFLRRAHYNPFEMNEADRDDRA